MARGRAAALPHNCPLVCCGPLSPPLTPPQSVKNGKYVAIKCMKAAFSSLEQVCACLSLSFTLSVRHFLCVCVQVNNLREVQALRRLSPHPHIVKLIEVLL